jgi:hypothetical protein
MLEEGSGKVLRGEDLKSGETLHAVSADDDRSLFKKLVVRVYCMLRKCEEPFIQYGTQCTTTVGRPTRP